MLHLIQVKEKTVMKKVKVSKKQTTVDSE